MLVKSLSLVSGLLLPASAETILGATVFSRHGDRSSKHYSGYSLTNLGVQQNFQSGQFFRERYISSESDKQILGISDNKADNKELFASSPDQQVLLNTATAFLQGLYPPLEGLELDISYQTLNNGSNVTNPLNGYQYVVLHGEEAGSPDTIWLKGDESCPAAANSKKNFEMSAKFQTREEKTKSFYESFWDVLNSVYDFEPEDLSYKNAYDIFDLINVASIHNASLVRNVTDEELFQLRTLADSAEFGSNYDSNEPARSMGGKTFAGLVLDQLNEMVSSKGQLKFSLLAGSYDTFLAFFGLAKLTSVSPDFFGLPDYASTMSFELFTPEIVTDFPSNVDDINVRFLFRNGSEAGAPLRTFPLFGQSKDYMSWSEFASSMRAIAITSAEEWCNTCQSDLLFCSAYNSGAAKTTASPNKGMSNAVAGVIGAMVTLAVVALVGAAAFFVLRRKSARKTPVTTEQVIVSDKRSTYSSDSEHA